MKRGGGPIKPSTILVYFSQQWAIVFRHVKLGTRGQVGRASDDLYVVVVSPTGLHLIKHDLAIEIDMKGKLTEVSGHRIQVTGSMQQHFLGGGSCYNYFLAVLARWIQLDRSKAVSKGRPY